LKHLSVFIDESGDFGKYECHSPYYIVTLIFHDQSNKLSCSVDVPSHFVHTGPLIRRELQYKNWLISERVKIFKSLFKFINTSNITYHPIIIYKKHLINENDLSTKIISQLTTFINENLDYFFSYTKVTVYYDFGQMELSKIIRNTFSSIISNVEFKKVVPAAYKLFQAADMFCTFELLSLKAEKKDLTKSEISFFESIRNLKKTYLRAIVKKRFNKK